MPHFLYVADPMCSWCYGFGPELRTFLNAMPDSKLTIVMGGLRAFNANIMDDAMRNMIVGHWDKVAQVSGLPFNPQALAAPGFIYNTEPACRAMVATRILMEEEEDSWVNLAVLDAIAFAFYAQAQDITDLHVLSNIASQALNTHLGVDSFDADSFYETLTALSTQNETKQDFAQTQRWGVQGFPALFLILPEGIQALNNGYCNAQQLQAAYATAVGS